MSQDASRSGNLWQAPDDSGAQSGLGLGGLLGGMFSGAWGGDLGLGGSLGLGDAVAPRTDTGEATAARPSGEQAGARGACEVAVLPHRVVVRR